MAPPRASPSPTRQRAISLFSLRAASTAVPVSGYAAALKADVGLRSAVYLVTPLALAAGWRAVRRVARQTGASILHAHWVVPGGFLAAMSNPELPLVISLHGSDVFVAEQNPVARPRTRGCGRSRGS